MEEIPSLKQPLRQMSFVERAPALLRSSRWSGTALACFLFLLAVLPYLNTLRNGFVYDDTTQVLNNPYLRDFGHLREIFTTTVLSYKGANAASNYYRPLMNFGYLLCSQLFGLRAFGFHLANLLLHGLVVVLLFKVTQRIFRASTVAFVAAAMFALHPIHTESVDWIAAVTDLELAFFYLLTFWFFLGLGGAKPSRYALAQLGMAMSFVLAALSKEPALTLPALATLYEHAYRDDRGQTTGSQKLLRYGALWVLAVAYLVLRVRFLGTLARARERLAGDEVLFSAFALFGQYMWKLLWPVRLCGYYVFEASDDPTDPRVLAGLGALVLVAVLFVALWKFDRKASFGLVWLVVTLAPVLNARWLAANVFTERYLYLPSVGFCWVIAWGWTRLVTWSGGYRFPWRGVFVAVLGVIASGWVIRIVTRNKDWYDDQTFYQRTLAASPKAYYMRSNLAGLYWDRGDVKSAEREYMQALELAPNAVIILNNLALLNLSLRHYEEVLGYSLRAVAVDPNNPEAHFNLGTAYAELGNTQDAERHLHTAVVLAPLNAKARASLGELYLDQSRLPEAEEQFRRSLETQPSLSAYVGLGLVRWRQGDRQEAEHCFKQAMSLEPSSARPHFMLGLLYLDLGRKDEGEKELRTGLESDPTNEGALAALQRLRR